MALGENLQFGPSDFDDFDTQLQSDEFTPEEYDAAFDPNDFLPYDEAEYPESDFETDSDRLLAEQELFDMENFYGPVDEPNYLGEGDDIW